MSNSLLESYVGAAREHGMATVAGDYKAGNKAHDRLMKALAVLRKRPDHGESLLLEALTYPDAWVRMWAATHLLPLDQEVGCAQLEMLASGAPGVTRLTASMTLKEWKAGRLKIP